MVEVDSALRKMNDYLKELREALRALSDEEARDIVEEIRSHIRDSAEKNGELSEEGVSAALVRLGPPGELGGRYRMESLAQKAERSRSPWLVMRMIVRWAGLSLEGAMVLLASLVGYGLAAAFVLCAVAKPFNPARVGLWRLSDADRSLSLHLGFRTPPLGTEILGWWIVPAGLLAGAILFLLTVRFGSRSLRNFRRTLPMPGRRSSMEKPSE